MGPQRARGLLVVLCVTSSFLLLVEPGPLAAPNAMRPYKIRGGSPQPASPGAELWVNRYNGQHNYDSATALGVSPDGSAVFVTGESYMPSTGWDYVTMAIDSSTGARLWLSRYNGPLNSADSATALGVSPDGSTVFVTGYSIGWAIYSDYATVAIDASTGAKLWVSRYSGPVNYDDSAYALGVSPDGATVFVTGWSYQAGGYDNATVAIDASTGTELWVSRSKGPANNYPTRPSLRVSPDGSVVFATGYAIGSEGDYDYATVAIDASSGGTLWANRYDGGSDDFASALGLSPDGSTVFVTGYSYRPVSGYDYATVALDASTGAELWVSRYKGPRNYESPTALGVSPDGSAVFVTGYSASTSSYDYATVAIDASTGAKLWVSRYNGGGDDFPFALGVSPDGFTVFVTGYRASKSYYDYATVAIDASTGAKLWVSRYNGPAHSGDLAYALSVSPDGSTVFVTGQSYGSTTGFEYATVAYSVR